LKYIMKALDHLMDRVFAVAGALACSQIPRFMQQYMDVMSGAYAESKKAMDILKEQAASTGKSLEEFINKHLQNMDPDFQASGRSMMSAFERMQFYKQTLELWRESPIWKKPYIFFTHLDMDLLAAVDFTPGLPLNAEGLVYALAGIVAGIIFYQLTIKFTYYILFGRKRKQAKPVINPPS